MQIHSKLLFGSPIVNKSPVISQNKQLLSPSSPTTNHVEPQKKNNSGDGDSVSFNQKNPPVKKAETNIKKTQEEQHKEAMRNFELMTTGIRSKL